MRPRSLDAQSLGRILVSLVQLENLEQSTAIVGGANLPRAVHERDILAKHLADESDQLGQALIVPLDIAIQVSVGVRLCQALLGIDLSNA